MHTIYTLVIWGVMSGTFPSKWACVDRAEYLASIDPTLEYKCQFTRGRVSWQQLK